MVYGSRWYSGVGVALATTLLIGGNYLLYWKTITPRDIANIGQYAQDMESQKLKRFFPQYHIIDHGFITKDSVNTVLGVGHAATCIYLEYKFKKLPLLKAVKIGGVKGVGAWLSSVDLRIPVAALISVLPFFRSGYNESSGLLATSITLSSDVCIKSLPFILGAPLLLWLTDRAIKKLEDKEQSEDAKRSLDVKAASVLKMPPKTPTAEKLVSAGNAANQTSHQPDEKEKSASRNSYSIQSIFSTKNIIKGVSFAAVVGLGFFCAKKLVADDTASRGTMVPLNPALKSEIRNFENYQLRVGVLCY